MSGRIEVSKTVVAAISARINYKEWVAVEVQE